MMQIEDVYKLAAARLTALGVDDDLDAGLITAICREESGCNPWSVRYEEGYVYTIKPSELPAGVRPPACTYATENNLQCCSFGLMQIMGATAREMGFKGWLSKLYAPETALDWGIEYLHKQWRRYQPMFGPDAVIAAYNAGSPRTGKNGAFSNQAYVDRVKRYWAAT